MRVVVYGLWHLGCVTAGCVAAAGHRVIGLDNDARRIDELNQGKPPLLEPGLPELLSTELTAGRLSFSIDAKVALADADILWVTLDTPVNEQDEADVEYVRTRLEEIADCVQRGTLVLISSQLPVGFTRELEKAWAHRGVSVAYSPENLRLGKAIEVFRTPERVILGIRSDADKPRLEAIFGPFCKRLEWMSIESAEMTKHAINAFLATSVTFINEIARLCEKLGADAREVERGLKSEGRIGPRAYLSPGVAFSGGTLARDIRYLIGFGEELVVETPLFRGVNSSNDVQKQWLRSRLSEFLDGIEQPVVGVLGLTYKPGTNTLRRSAAVEQCVWLHQQGVKVKAHDPAVTEIPEELHGTLTLCDSADEALRGADVAVLATEWPQFKTLGAGDFVRAMRQARVIDQNRFLGDVLATDGRVAYIATGKAA